MNEKKDHRKCFKNKEDMLKTSKNCKKIALFQKISFSLSNFDKKSGFKKNAIKFMTRGYDLKKELCHLVEFEARYSKRKVSDAERN